MPWSAQARLRLSLPEACLGGTKSLLPEDKAEASHLTPNPPFYPPEAD
jgi:hypothetical protein